TDYILREYLDFSSRRRHTRSKRDWSSDVCSSDLKQFFIGEGKEVGRKWQIPLNSNYAAVPKIMKDGKLVVGDYAGLIADNGVPFRLNVGNNSDFIVKYDKTLLDDILIHIDELDAVDKLQLLQDFRL